MWVFQPTTLSAPYWAATITMVNALGTFNIDNSFDAAMLTEVRFFWSQLILIDIVALDLEGRFS